MPHLMNGIFGLFRSKQAVGFFQKLGGEPLSGEVGGKVRGLAALAEAGFVVPPTWVIPAEVLARLFAPGEKSSALHPEASAAFLAETAVLLAGHWPVIIRSSAAEEDGSGCAWPGIFESVIARDLDALPGALARCLNSYRAPRAAAYRRAHGLPEPAAAGMAAAVQPFLLAERAGVGAVYHRDRVVIELARGYNLAITRGKRAPFRFVYDLVARRPGLVDERWLGREELNRLVATLLKVQGTLFHNQNVSVEFVLRGSQWVLLQARPNPSGAAEEELVDLPGLYARLGDMMAGFGFTPSQWSLLETTDLLAFHYLGRRRHRNEPMEHFRIRLHGPAARDARQRGWVDSRFAPTVVHEEVLSPPLTDAAGRARIEALSRDGIMVIFCPDEAEKFPRRERSFMVGGQALHVGFSYPLSGAMPGLSGGPVFEEWDFERRRLRRDAALRRRERLESEERDLVRIRALLAGRIDSYERGLRKQVDLLLHHMRGHRSLVEGVLAEGRRDGEVVGLPFRTEPRVVHGTAVTPRTIAKARTERFVYFADDLEPSFLDHIGRMDAVVVSRGAFCSHAAALCSEFNVPLVVETRNLDSISDGDQVAVDLSDGTVRLELPGLARARRLLAEGEPGRARTELEAQAGAVDSAEGCRLLGDACRLSGSAAAAVEHYREALRLDGSCSQAELHLAEFSLAAGRLEEAEAALGRALAVEPEIAHAHQLRAELLLARGRPASAADAAERAVAADPGLRAARLTRAKTLRATGKREAAQVELAAVLEADPKNGEAARLELELLLDIEAYGPAAELAFKRICLVGDGFVRSLNGLARSGKASAAADLLVRLLGAVPDGCAFDPQFLLGADREILDAASAGLEALEPARADICLVLAAHWGRAGRAELERRLRERAQALSGR